MTDSTTWHCWFAWHPVRVQGRGIRWLRWVMRKGHLHTDTDWADSWWTWEYRP